MHRLKLIALGSFMVACLSTNAQYMKSGYVTTGNTNDSFSLSSWTAGTDYTGAGDDNFFISRVKPKARFTNTATQVNTSLVPWWDWKSTSTTTAGNYSRKIVMWTPIGFGHSVKSAESPYMAMPNGIFNNEVFTMWQYISSFGEWGENFMRLPANFTDVAHKNGVAVLTTLLAAQGNMSNTNWKTVIQNLGSNTTKAINYLKYYGIDGIGYNSEWDLSSTYGNYLLALNKAIATSHSSNTDLYPSTFSAENLWYDGCTESSGSLTNSFDHGITSTSKTKNLFGESNNKRTSFFLNYNWNGNYSVPSTTKGKAYLPETLTYVSTTLGRNPFDVYAGFDLQGKQPDITTGNKSDSENKRFDYLTDKNVSFGFWSGHDTNTFWESRNAEGSTPTTAQATYQKHLERWFTNSAFNPTKASTFTVTNSLSNDLNEDFFGMSKFVAAQSTLSWDLATEPFITYFNVGNGQFFNWQGVRQHSSEWYNIGVQDYLPTWRWWWSTAELGRDASTATTDLTASFAWNDAWFGGSSLRIKGTNTTNEYLHLFKTKFDIQAGDTITVRYKINGGSTDCSLVLGTGTTTISWNPNTDYVVSSSDNTVLAKWVTKQFVVKGSNEVAVVALDFSNATNLDMNIGEFSIKRGKYAKPATPVISSSKLLAYNMKGVDGKVVFNMTDNANKYNIDHNVSMFKIYAKITYGDGTVTTTLMGATTSWAGLFYACPVDYTKVEDGATVNIGVSSVGLDNVTESDIAWGENLPLKYTGGSVDYVTNNDITVSNSYITNGQSATIGYADPHHAAAQSWKLVGPINNVLSGLTPTGSDGKEVATSAKTFDITADVNSTTVDISKLPYGFYDLIVTESDGTVRTLPAFVQVYSSNIGAPVIKSFKAVDTDGSNNVIAPVTDENAFGTYLNKLKNNYFWGNTGTQLEKTSTATLPGGGIRVKSGETLTMHYVANSNALGEASTGAILNDQALGVKASDIGLTSSTQSFSVAFWIKLSSVYSNSWLLNIRDPEDDIWPQRAWGWFWGDLHSDGSNTVSTVRGTAENQYHFDNNEFKLEKNAWYHIAYVFNNTGDEDDNLTIYLNGKVLTPSSETNSTATWANFKGGYTIAVGGIAGKGGYAGFNGVIDNFQVYNKAITADEVKTSMGQISDPNNVSGLVGFWTLEETYNNGYPNEVTAYKDAKLLHHYYPVDGADGDTQTKVITESTTGVGYPGFTGTKQVAVTPTYLFEGASSSNVLQDGTTVDGSDVDGSVKGTSNTHGVTAAQSVVKKATSTDNIEGYVQVTFPQTQNKDCYIYTAKLNLDNGLGQDNAEYKYIYVVNSTSPIITGVDDINKADVKTYPNPFVNSINVKFGQEGNYVVRIIDSFGKVVNEVQKRAEAGETTQINVNVVPGIYIAQIINNGKVVGTVKLIKK
jgi:endo-beta-N-acetylglucosaminidase D